MIKGHNTPLFTQLTSVLDFCSINARQVDPLNLAGASLARADIIVVVISDAGEETLTLASM